MAEITAVTTENFEEEILKSDAPVLVDFWAEWCPPCKMVEPVVEVVAEKFAGRLKVARANVDEAGELAQRYQIRSIPSLLFFKDGEVVETVIGFRPEDELSRTAEKIVREGS